ncbi:hypothetical protein XM38_028310 [Halomicronema hongdechloris C2206]|uniref:Uncharacterized protein n=1 Tax=Halomicronema hongdechloris C2206 TaxID=1641165 RepID=A0A1Z3HNY8_9CYAN|nr:hypothetical protein XM38_028310 [Halomicronema hongdechloris C2206]
MQMLAQVKSTVSTLSIGICLRPCDIFLNPHKLNLTALQSSTRVGNGNHNHQLRKLFWC